MMWGSGQTEWERTTSPDGSTEWRFRLRGDELPSPREAREFERIMGELEAWFARMAAPTVDAEAVETPALTRGQA